MGVWGGCLPEFVPGKLTALFPPLFFGARGAGRGREGHCDDLQGGCLERCRRTPCDTAAARQEDRRVQAVALPGFGQRWRLWGPRVSFGVLCGFFLCVVFLAVASLAGQFNV